jgi:hypothetical protein
MIPFKTLSPYRTANPPSITAFYSMEQTKCMKVQMSWIIKA